MTIIAIITTIAFIAVGIVGIEYTLEGIYSRWTFALYALTFIATVAGGVAGIYWVATTLV